MLGKTADLLTHHCLQGTATKLCIASRGTDNFLQAVAPIKSKEIIAVVPRKECLSLPVNHTALKDLLSPTLDRHWPIFLATSIVSERAKGVSNWSQYISLLPQHFPTMPIFFSRSQLEALRYHPLFQRILDTNKMISRTADVLGKEQLSHLAWATTCVSSRAFTLFGDTNQHDRCMVPVIDMANHSATPNAKVSQDAKTRSVVLSALRDIEPGTEVTISCVMPTRSLTCKMGI